MYPTQRPRGNRLATLGLVFALLGCVPGLSLLGAWLGLVAYRRWRAEPERGGRNLSIAAMGVGVLVTALSAFLFATVVPRYLTLGARSKMTECKVNLQRFLIAEQAHYLEGNAYTTRLADLSFLPEPRNRYTYILDASGPLFLQGADDLAAGGHTGLEAAAQAIAGGVPPDPGALLRVVTPGVSGDCPRCEVTVACIGNIDTDPTLDVWSVSTANRVSEDGEIYRAGELWHHIDDAYE